MGEDTSLEDFLDAEGGRGETGSAEDGPAADWETGTDDGDWGAETDADNSGGDGDDVEAGGDDGDDALARDPGAVAPASATHAWTPDGASCDGCGDVVERRWRDESGLVCEDCKDW